MSYRTVERGTVKYFNFTKKFGFIIPDNGEDDIFVHYSDICGEYPNKRLFKGDAVEFATIDDERGKKKAIEVKKIQSANEDDISFHADESQFSDNHYDDQEPPFVDLLSEKHVTADISNVADFLGVEQSNIDVARFITIKFKHFRAISEKTGNIFSGHLEVIYEPTEYLLDQNAFANYLNHFNELEVNDEQVVTLIYQHLMDKLKPHTLEVTGSFKLHKQMETNVTVGNIQP